MNNKAKFLSILIILNILISISISFFNYDVKAVTQSISSDIDSLNNDLYPNIKSMINSLKATYKNWNFKILYTDIEWKDAITYEYIGHESSPKNLAPANNSKYAGSWVCPICKDAVYDSEDWVCASEPAIKYMMDTRNSLNSSDVFQFMELSYDNSYTYDEDIVASMLSGSFLDEDKYVDIIMEACKTYNANPYYIVARILQEQDKDGTTLVEGNGYKGQYVGYYNIFNIGASGNGEDKVILNGLKKAEEYEWTSLELALRGGIKIIAENYIAVGQNTLYLQKFDVDNSDGKLFWHQYMQNILAAQNEGTELKKTLQENRAINYPYTFIIPVYKNMPASACARPSTTTSLTSIESDLVRVNVNENIKMRNEPNGSTRVDYLYKNEIATRIERATTKVAGVYWDKVVKNNGAEGYVARSTADGESEYKLYLIQLNEDDDYTGNTTTPETDKTTPTIVKGDVSGDGRIDSMDMYNVIQHILGNMTFNDDQKNASDLNDDGNIDSMDMYLIIQEIINN